jgi:hypothetical protein
MATATFIRQMNWESDARLYRVVPPVSQTRWNPDSDQDETNTHSIMLLSLLLASWAARRLSSFRPTRTAKLTTTTNWTVRSVAPWTMSGL